MRLKVFGYANRTHARPAAAVRDAERFVEVEVANIRTNCSRRGKPHLCIHVCTIHVNLPAIRVNDLANFLNRCLKNPVRGWIRDHERGQVLLMLLGFFSQIHHIYIAHSIAIYDHYFHTRHDGRRRIRTMR